MDDLSKPFSVISIGDLVADLVVTIPRLPVEANAHQLARSITLEPGGAGNFLIAGARLGMRMLALGTTGEDIFGRAILESLAREGVDITPVVRQPGASSTTVIVLVDNAGRHVYLGGYGSGPLLEMPQGWVDVLPGVQAVFASGYTLQERRLAEAALQAMELAHRQSTPVFFDPGPEMADATPGQVQRVLGTSLAILLTEEEIPLMTGGVAGLPAAMRLLEGGPRLVCVKRGAQGCVILTPEATVEHPGYPVPVRDTTAAGDSFDAAFIYACLRAGILPGGKPERRSLEQAAAFANAMGAAKVQKIGSGAQVPTLAEVRSILEAFDVQIGF